MSVSESQITFAGIGKELAKLAVAFPISALGLYGAILLTQDMFFNPETSVISSYADKKWERSMGDCLSRAGVLGSLNWRDFGDDGRPRSLVINNNYVGSSISTTTFKIMDGSATLTFSGNDKSASSAYPLRARVRDAIAETVKTCGQKANNEVPRQPGLNQWQGPMSFSNFLIPIPDQDESVGIHKRIRM